jgi:alpha-1,2-mannosyltransferase
MEIVAWHPRRELTPGKVTRVSSVLERRDSTTPRNQGTKSRLLLIGGVSFAVVLAGWLAYAFTHPAPYTVDPADLQVYNNGGFIIRHVRPPYDARYPYPLYDWPKSKAALRFTYTPFAAIFFAAISYIPWSVLPRLSQLANLLLLVAAAWLTAGVLGNYAGGRSPVPPVPPAGNQPGGRRYRAGSLARRTRLGAALLGSAAALLTEPVFRTMYLGQVNLLLMALVIGDLAQPDGRRLKGVAVGIAAGIKLIPLVFIPYLLLTRRFRAAAMATGTFAATVVLGFLVVPGDSTDWWLQGLFLNGSRTGFVGWGGNQSLRAILTRFAGSIHGATAAWMAAALLAAVIGLASAVLLDRAGHAMLAILATALVGLLDSPISWDHHWVWVVPGMMAAARYASRAWQAGKRRAARWCAALAGALLLAFAAWPGALWSVPVTGAGDFTNGLIWAGPNSRVTQYTLFGDKPGFLEYHWRGLQNLSGNAFVLTGLALLVLLAVVAVRTLRGAADRHA